MNPFYRQPQGGLGPFQNIANVMSSFQQFRSMFQGDPKAKVEELMRNGQMSQQQFQQLSQLAQNFRSLVN